MHEETCYHVDMNITPTKINNKKTIRQRYDHFKQCLQVAAQDRIHEDHHAVYANQGDDDIYAGVWLTHPSIGDASSGWNYRDNLHEMIDEKLRSYRFE